MFEKIFARERGRFNRLGTFLERGEPIFATFWRSGRVFGAGEVRSAAGVGGGSG